MWKAQISANKRKKTQISRDKKYIKRKKEEKRGKNILLKEIGKWKKRENSVK